MSILEVIMSRNLDIIHGLLAWACVPLIIWAPAFFVSENSRPILLAIWGASIGASLVFRRRPWSELWGIWLSGVVLWEVGYHYLFIVWVMVIMAVVIHKVRWKNIIKLDNTDYTLCLMAWGCALAARLANDLPLPGDRLAYELYYFPGIWACCMAGIFLIRKHPWRELWWVFLSGPFALLFWLIMIYLIVIGAWLN